MMREAARAFVGMRDFHDVRRPRTRAATSEPPPSTLVLVDQIEIVEQGDLMLVAIQGSHFLWKMVRRMVGVLVEIGRGALPPGADPRRCSRRDPPRRRADGAAVGSVSREGLLRG